MIAILTLLGVIVGALITAGSSFLLEERRQKWASEERKYATAEKKYLTFAERRLNALQNAVQLCDFVDTLSVFGRLSAEAQADWRRIRRETLAHGALMPASVQEEFQTVLRIMPFEPYAPDAEQNALPIIPPTHKLRTLCLEAIESEYQKFETGRGKALT